MNAFTIKDLENLSGIKAHTIRIWEQRYHFLKPQRTGTNIRYYSNEELKTILNIALLNKYGFKISHIDRMQPGEIREKLLSLRDGNAIQERIVNELVQEMVDLNMEKLEKLLTGYITTKGIERTVMQIIFPFLEKIGLLWVTGHINPAQEHLVTNIIRQKLIVAIDSSITHLKTDRNVLLFLPEGEHHELGILFMNYLLRSRGIKTIYLGANIPIKDVAFVVKQLKPDILFTHLTATSPNFNFEKFITNFSSQLSDIQIVISGLLIHSYKKELPERIIFKKSISEVIDCLTEL
jgi:MerR family transcriptional regulator, light-induced transcriptional regulator